jgi:hypothetical protein
MDVNDSLSTLDNLADSPSVTPAELQTPSEQEVQTEIEDFVEAAGPAEPAYGSLDLLVRLLVGATLEGGDLVIQRLQEWQTAVTSEAADETLILPDNPLRQALVGLALLTPQMVRRGVARAGQTAARWSDWMADRGLLDSRLVNNRLTNNRLTNNRLTNNRMTQGLLLEPAREGYSRMAARRESVVEQWIQLGRSEEPELRLLARRAAQETIDEFIRRLSENPELQDLIQTQSVGLATEVAGGVRSQTVSADAAVERLARSVFRRSSAEPAAEPTTEPSPTSKKSSQ